MIPLEMTTTSVAGEVKLYLAVPIPWSSRLGPSGPIPSSSPVHLWAGSWSAAARLEVAVRSHERLRHLQDQGPEIGTRGPRNPYPFRASFRSRIRRRLRCGSGLQRGTDGIREERGPGSRTRAASRPRVSLAEVPDDASRRTSAALSWQPSLPRTSGSVSRAGRSALGVRRTHRKPRHSGPVVVRVSSQRAAAFCIDAGGPGDRHRGGSSSRPRPIL